MRVFIQIVALFLYFGQIEAYGGFNAISALQIKTVADLKFDENDRLAENYVLYTARDLCESVVSQAWNSRRDYNFMNVVSMSDSISDEYWFSQTAIEENTCNVVNLEKGMPSDSLRHTIPEKVLAYEINMDNIEHGRQDISAWFANTAMFSEIGFLSWNPNPCEIYWINGDGSKVKVANLKQRERNTQWQTTTLGHSFEIIDSVTNESLGVFPTSFSHINIIGTVPPEELRLAAVSVNEVAKDVKATFDQEWKRAHRVTRTFTELGFNKGRLPDDLWTSMKTYYYNNQYNMAIEEWGGKGVFVNWWEVPSYMIGMPWGLKKYWQSRLKTLVEEWSGIELELTDIYGMRRYEDGARLLTHVDREATHAASLIINIAQGNMRRPWMLEIYDFANRLHEVEMDEGDIVYYESARCLHGRMAALHGQFYVNLFAHYRPPGDPTWFTKDNPEGTPEQMIEVETASTGMQQLYDQFISTSNQVLTGPRTLYDFWHQLTIEAGESHGFDTVSIEL